MHLATVDGRGLTKILRQMRRIRGRKMGAAFWRFEEGVLIDWAGMEIGVEGAVITPLPHGIMVPGRFMKHATVKLRYAGPTEIHWLNKQFIIGPDRVVAEEASGPRIVSLPVDAREVDLLKVWHRHLSGALYQSGYYNEMVTVQNKLQRSISKVAKALAWLDIDEEQVRKFVRQKLAPDDEGDIN